VRRLLDRGEEGAVPATLDQALALNPVNVAALDLRYELVASRGTPADRVAGLLGILRGNPIRPAAMAELARVLASAGLTKESLEWFARATDLYGVTGAPDRQTYHDLVVDYAAQVYIAGQVQAARGIVDQLLKADPGDVDAWLLRLVVDRSGDEKSGAYAKTREAAAAELWTRWGRLRRTSPPRRRATGRARGGRAGPGNKRRATPTLPRVAPAAGAGNDAPADPAQPIDHPEPATVAERVKASRDERKQALFVSAAADFAWFEVFFNGDPAAAGKWIDALAAVLPEDNVTLVRLRGWMQLAAKQHEEARQTSRPYRGPTRSPALGMARLEWETAGGDAEAERAADDRARDLLGRHPAGLVGAILTGALKERALKPEPSPDAAAIRQELQKFPHAWLEVAADPQRFYNLRVEPLRVAHRFGEPMFARVTLQNLTDFDISVGDDGVIRPGLWFDAQVQAMRARQVPGTAFERLGQVTVLPARQAVSQYVRFDQGGLAELLAANPSPQLQITGWCMTNPVRLGDGFGPGPGGVRVPFSRKVARTGFPINKPGVLEQLVRGGEAGLPEMKVRNLNLMGVLASALRKAAAPPNGQQQPGAGAGGPADEAAPQAPPPPATAGAEQGGAVADKLVEHIAAVTADEVPAVAQWAKFELAHAGDPPRQAEAIESLLADSRWEGRLLGLVAAPRLSPAKAEDLAAKVAEADGGDAVGPGVRLGADRSAPTPSVDDPAGGW
jgi:tetratricopeptide (TPR) repeat protein